MARQSVVLVSVHSRVRLAAQAEATLVDLAAIPQPMLPLSAVGAERVERAGHILAFMREAPAALLRLSRFQIIGR